MRIVFYCTGTAPEPWLAGLRAALPEADVFLWTHGAPQADHAVVWAPPQAFIDEQPGLQTLFNIGAGVDALLRLQLPPGVQVVRLDDAGMSVQMAEYVCQAVIRHFREFDVSERDMAQGRWAFRKPRLRSDFPVGVMGLGVLGTRVAQALRVFEFPVLGWSRSPKDVPGVQTLAGEDRFHDFLASCRVLVNLLPLTAQTENILNRHTLSRLQPGGYLINVARGAHLVDADLLALLDEGHLAGATLDVFRSEPLPPEHPFWGHPKLTLTPHTSARTLRDESIAQIAGKIRALAAGQPVAGVVNRSLGY
ncbi:MAG TPA: glyoxylate/hydroxypyruvate reductase A [Burkholderiaceae bacterium]|nr:glyoxylate/hydroxypyruvate reductase A [Burkholderiaceae bacterium]